MPATVHPAETSQRDIDAAPVMTTGDCYLSATVEISARCRVGWNGQTYAVAGDVDTWRSGSHVRYLRVTLVRVLGVTAAHQVLPEALQTATVSIRRPGTVLGPLDPDTLTRPSTPLAAHYAGPGRVYAAGGQALSVDAGDNAVSVADYVTEVLAEVDTARVGDLVTVSGSGDAQLDASTLRVTEVTLGTARVVRLLGCELVTDD